jgi:AraC-like DNA-binding protein
MQAEPTGTYRFYHLPGLPGVELVKGMNVTHSFPRHTHRDYCIGIIDEGFRRYLAEGRTETIGAGGSLWIHPDQGHACSPAGNQGHSYRMLCLEPGYFRRLFAAAPEKNLPNPLLFKAVVMEDPVTYNHLAILMTILERPGSLLEKESSLFHTLAPWVQDQDCPSRAAAGKEGKPIDTVRDFLESHYMENSSLGKLAELAGLSPYYFLRLFQRKVGLSPHLFQTQIRIQKSKQKLLQGESILDAALETGFSDQSHFTRFFKRMTGLTPGEFQNTQQ